MSTFVCVERGLIFPMDVLLFLTYDNVYSHGNNIVVGHLPSPARETSILFRFLYVVFPLNDIISIMFSHSTISS